MEIICRILFVMYRHWGIINKTTEKNGEREGDRERKRERETERQKYKNERQLLLPFHLLLPEVSIHTRHYEQSLLPSFIVTNRS